MLFSRILGIMEVSNKEEYPLMKTDIEIAQSIELKPIVDVVEKIGLDSDDLELYGKYKAKLSFDRFVKLRKIL